ncbi:hypothetical protein OOK36_44570 [Streptomyces sp. NBC_00365]|uniref:hypothetical protein n=1 Tax=Streptomyces sp. NBC_00365 TaxID=2975726 RepID=UPI00225A3AD7|nr:hypothetical protein [Streptomyces sp. NBC_00365]MCX5095780.1 hypothetical protein [Streptomyces sp. NBC_00365]
MKPIALREAETHLEHLAITRETVTGCRRTRGERPQPRTDEKGQLLMRWRVWWPAVAGLAAAVAGTSGRGSGGRPRSRPRRLFADRGYDGGGPAMPRTQTALAGRVRVSWSATSLT